MQAIAAKAHAVGAMVLIDGAQSAPHLPIDVQAIDCDFLAFSGHKMLGPMGSGALYGKRALLDAMPPFMGGGGMIRKVTIDGSTYADGPARFEAGTPAVGDAIGLGAAVEYLNALGMDAHPGARAGVARVRAGPAARSAGLTQYGPTDTSVRSGVISFTLGEIHAARRGGDPRRARTSRSAPDTTAISR